MHIYIAFEKFVCRVLEDVLKFVWIEIQGLEGTEFRKQLSFVIQTYMYDATTVKYIYIYTLLT